MQNSLAVPALASPTLVEIANPQMCVIIAHVGYKLGRLIFVESIKD